MKDLEVKVIQIENKNKEIRNTKEDAENEKMKCESTIESVQKEIASEILKSKKVKSE